MWTDSCKVQGDVGAEVNTPLWLRVPPNIQPLLRSGDVLMQTLASMHMDLAMIAAPPLATTITEDSCGGEVHRADMQDAHARYGGQVHMMNCLPSSAASTDKGKHCPRLHSTFPEDLRKVLEAPEVR